MSRRTSLRLPALAGIVAASLLAGCAAPVASGAGPPSASSQGPLNTSSRIKVADAAVAAGNTDLAATLYTRALADPALSAAARIRAADMLAQLGHVSAAETALTQRLAHPSALSGVDEAELRRALARLHIVAGQPAQAMIECDALLTRNGADRPALVDKAVALDLLGRHGEAQALYRRALAMAPDDAAVRSDLALSEALQGRVGEAASVVAPLQARADLPDRVKTDLGLLSAANNDRGTAAVWLDGRAPEDADVVLLADAIRARSAAQGH